MQANNSRIQEKIYCVSEEKLIDRSELVHGFPIQKGKYVTFTNEELKKLESGAGHEIEIIEFIPISEVDSVYFAGARAWFERLTSARNGKRERSGVTAS